MRGVELDGELPAGEAEAVVDRSENAGGVAERERILEVARRARLPQVRAVQQLSHQHAAAHDAGIRARRCHRRVQRRGIGRKRLPVQRRADGAGVEQAEGVGQRERGESGAERVVVDQRDALLGGEGHVAADPEGEVGERAEVALARGAEHAHARRLAGVECVDDTRQELGPHTRGALRKPVREPHHRGAHDLARCVGPGRHAVVAQQTPVVGVHLVALDAHPLADADAGRDAVDAVGARHCPLDHGARGADAIEGGGRDLDALITAGDAHDLGQCELLAVQDHAHREPVCRCSHRPGRGGGRPGHRPELPIAARRTMDSDARRALVRAPGGDRPARLAFLLVLARARGHEPRHLGRCRGAAARDARSDRRPGLRLGGRGRGVPARRDPGDGARAPARPRPAARGPGRLRAARRRRLGADGHDRATPGRSSRSRSSAASRPGSSRSSRPPSCRCSSTTRTWMRRTAPSSAPRRSRTWPASHSAARSWDSRPPTTCCC